MKNLPPYIFVYGTLMKGIPSPYSNLLSKYARFRGEATTNGNLFDLGHYPGLQYLPDSPSIVFGQLFELQSPVSDFAWLDSYEGVFLHNPEYERRAIWIDFQDSRMIAQAYVLLRSTSNLYRIDSGNYFKYFHHHVKHWQTVN